MKVNAKQIHSPRTSPYGNKRLRTDPNSTKNQQAIVKIVVSDDPLIDVLISRLLEVRSTIGKPVEISETEIKYLCDKASAIFLDQSALLELGAPNIGYPPLNNFLFLGDYVDRGKNSIETICLLLAYKIKYPENFFLLRGNHESAQINRIYGFYDECKRRFNVKVWKDFSNCFNLMPFAAIVQDTIFCCHGGLSPDLAHVKQIENISRPTEIPDKGLLCDLLWSDPDNTIPGWGTNDRGISYIFGKEVVERFLKKHDFDLICRAHQVVEDGYEFFAQRKLVTVFSAPNYCGEFDNAAAIMSVDESLQCSFQM